jgi:hypothetical protein
MRCEMAQRSLSVAMDEREGAPAEVEEHRRGCPSCGAFSRAAWRVRELSRFEVAQPVPDLVPAIMARIRAERRVVPHVRPPAPRPADWLLRQRAAAVALVAGLITGLLVTSGGIVPLRREVPAALAVEIPRRLVGAAEVLVGYRATFDITELNWTRAVSRRTFVADLAFRGPERFRVRVRDTTSYPSAEWPRNDLELVTDGRTWLASGPDPCPHAALPSCPSSAPVRRSVANRPPFDPRTALPTDVIVPMTVLAASSRVQVTGSGEVAGMDAVAVQLGYQDATPLFEYLRFLGSWRPFFPRDRVLVWLDSRTWFPLRYQVFPAPGVERSTWASQAGLPAESPGSPVFTATVRSVSTLLPSSSLFIVAPGEGAIDHGFRDVPVARLAGPGGIVAPARMEGLTLGRSGRFARTRARPFRQSILAYTRGLTWLTVTQVRGWNQTHLFGVGPFAEEVTLPSSGVAYYEPATALSPRRIALHTSVGEFLLATNLPRAELLSAAGSLSVEGLAKPSSWRIKRWGDAVVQEGLTPSEAIADARFAVALPSTLPPGYTAVSAVTVRTSTGTGVTIMYRRPAAELGGPGLRLHQATGQSLPPPTGADEQIVQVGDSTGRWSPEAHILDWVDDDGIYRSLSGPGLDLVTLLEVAVSLRPVEDGSP